MPLNPAWADIAIRFLLTMIAGAVIGLNRGARGHAAALRTTILVALAASVAMIQAHRRRVHRWRRHFETRRTGDGRDHGSHALGRDCHRVVSRRGPDRPWHGCHSVERGYLVDTKMFDRRIPREQRAMLVVEAGRDPASVADVVNLITPLGYTARFQAQRSGDSDSRVALCFQISWRRAEAGGPPLDLLDILNGRFAVASFTLTSEAAINE
jgi:putative Mg2+ transporter-C (MgtC) family protein